MENYVWLFPVLFIFHDMEEIIGMGAWLQKNGKMLDKRFPKISGSFAHYSTEGMALAVFEELLVCIAICILSLCLDWYALWLGGLIAYTVHLAVHIVQAVVVRMYLPALATSMIALPVSVLLIKKCMVLLQFTAGEAVLYGIIGLMLIALNLKFAHRLMRWYTVRLGGCRIEK